MSITVRAIAVLSVAILAFSPAIFSHPKESSYGDLIALFHDWRQFQKPRVTDGVADYSPATIAARDRKLQRFQSRLAGLDISSWTIPQKIDYNLVRAEMNGMDFDDRVLHAWARDPAFYVLVEGSESDVPLREGPHAYGTLETWQYRFPLSAADAAEVKSKLDAIPQILASAETNLTEANKDLWTIGIHTTRQERATLAEFSNKLSESNPALLPASQKALASIDQFIVWLADKAAAMKTSKPIGIENYNWYLKNVHLVPYNWAELIQIEQRELERSLSSLQLERQHNRNLPELQIAADAEELRTRNNAAVDAFREFLVSHEIFTVRSYQNQHRLYMTIPSWKPVDQLDVFEQVEYRNSLPMKTHAIHWFEKQRLDREPNASPIRSSRLLYNIWDNRSEGFATAWEEVMMNAGLYDKIPRARELVYFLTAFRCVRGIADLKMHSGEFSLDDAFLYVTKTTPNGWAKPGSPTLWGDLQIYASQPSYGTTYIAGKIAFDRLIADAAAKDGSDFHIKDFMDRFFDTGVIPMSMIRWEMTGREDELDTLGVRR